MPPRSHCSNGWDVWDAAVASEVFASHSGIYRDALTGPGMSRMPLRRREIPRSLSCTAKCFVQTMIQQCYCRDVCTSVRQKSLQVALLNFPAAAAAAAAALAAAGRVAPGLLCQFLFWHLQHCSLWVRSFWARPIWIWHRWIGWVRKGRGCRKNWRRTAPSCGRLSLNRWYL